MSATEILAKARALPLEEQREIVEALLDDLESHESPEFLAELERRAEDALKNPGRGTPIEEVSAAIRERLLAKK